MNNFKIIREWIKFLLEKDVIGEPDLTNKEERDKDLEDQEKNKKNKIEMSAGGVPGVSTPLGTGPTYPAKIIKKNKKRQKKK